jgi:hypothetical protein
MFTSLLIAAALTSIAGRPDVPPGPQRQLVLEIVGKTVYADGSTRGWAGDSDPASFGGYVYTGATGCELGAADNEPAKQPSSGWRIAGRVLQRTNDTLLVRIEWQRVWEQSRRLPDGLKGSMEVSIREGDRLPLDEINSAPAGPCQALGVRLEAAVLDRPVTPPTAKMRGGVGAGAGRIGGIGQAAGAGTGQGVAVGGYGPGIASTTPAELDVWLVHTRADGTEDAQYQRVRTPEGRFQFPAITIATANGDASVQIGGGVAAIIDVTGEKQLRLAVQRRIAGGGQGQSLSAYQMPGPDDVYAIELPDIRAKGEIVKADSVSIRLRLAR